MAAPARTLARRPMPAGRSITVRSTRQAPLRRPLTKATAGVQPAERPRLTVVPRRRRAARLAAVACAVVVLAMLGAAAFQTLLAQRQLELDRLDQSIADERARYEELRRDRSELRSPGRLAELASSLGMVPATESEFAAIDPEVLAVVQRSVGTAGQTTSSGAEDQLTEFGEIKAVFADDGVAGTGEGQP